MFSNFFFFFEKSAIYDILEEYCGTEKATDDNMAHAYCILDT